MRIVAFVAVILLVLALGYGYVGWRLTAPLERGSAARRRVWLAVAALPLVVLAGFFMRFSGEGAVADVAAWIGFATLGLSSLLFTLLIIRDIVWLGAAAVARHAQRDIDPERRRVLLSTLNLGKLGASGMLFGYGSLSATDVPPVREVRVPLVDLPEAFDGFRIVQITDLHVGPTIKRDHVASVVEACNQLDADMVAITGDLVDGTVARLGPDVAPLAELRSRHGTFFVTGNHEYYSGVDAWVSELRRIGMQVLLNEHRVIEVGGARLTVAGCTDYRAGSELEDHATSPGRALEGAPDGVKLMLAHQPRSIFETAAAGADLQISGHTHGGQFFPWNLFAHFGQPYVSGLHRHDGTFIYVSRGTGYWGPPLRLAAPSEITLLILTRAG